MRKFRTGHTMVMTSFFQSVRIDINTRPLYKNNSRPVWTTAEFSYILTRNDAVYPQNTISLY
ncbi:hypothetical protein [Peribacillus frigoritolerans]|uniref:hypothetical protein n=1 Tax=Peribacillus frigoritolerans TaxID=450367 RepID=UPI0021AAAC03|nr:hypothetical protein [Peribacillus frigoritolerans]